MSLLRKTGFRIVDSDGNILLYDYSQGESSTRRLTFSVGASNEPYMEYSSALGGIAFSGTIYSGGYEVLTTNSTISVGDADTLDSLDSTQFLRSDAEDEWNVGRGVVYIENNTNDNADGAGITLRTSSNPTDGAIFAVRSSGQAARFWVGQDITSTGYNPLHVGSSDSIDATATPYILLPTSGNITRDGNTVWDAGNHGSGSGLDADLLDGVQGSSYLRSDVSGTISGDLTISDETPALVLSDTNNSHGGGAQHHILFNTTGGVQGYIGIPNNTDNDIYISNVAGGAAGLIDDNSATGDINIEARDTVRITGTSNSTNTKSALIVSKELNGPEPLVTLAATYETDTSYTGHGSILELTTNRGDGFSDGYLLSVSNDVGSALYVQGDRKIGILNTDPQEALHISGNMLLDSTDAGASAGPTLELYRNSASPATDDQLGEIIFSGNDASGNKRNNIRIYQDYVQNFGVQRIPSFIIGATAEIAGIQQSELNVLEANRAAVSLMGDVLVVGGAGATVSENFTAEKNLTVDGFIQTDTILSATDPTTIGIGLTATGSSTLHNLSLTGNLAINNNDASITLNDTSGSPTDQGIRIRAEAIDTALPNNEGIGIIFEESPTNGSPDTTPAVITTGEFYAQSNQRVFHDTYHPNADKWTTARTLLLSGDASGSVSWDGSADATLSVAVTNDSHTHDTRYYTETEIATFLNRSFISNHSASNLAVGWYTIATNTGDRASARFGIWDTQGSRHQSVTFYAAHHYGTDASNTITVLDNSYFSGNPFRYIRIKDAGTYDGAALQIYIDDASNAVNAAILGDNFQSSGWVLCDWIPDATTPPNVSNYSNFAERSRVDLDQIAQGGFATTGPIYADGDTSQYRVFNDNYHPNADKWTTARTLSLTGDVTGSVSWDGSGNASMTTTVGDDSHTHAFDNLTGKTSGTGDYATTGDIQSGKNSGGVALTINDGKGNANVTWNHRNGVPEQNGNAMRIEGNTDSTSGATLWFEGKSNVTGGTSVELEDWFTMSSSGATCLGNTVWHAGNDGSGSGLDADTLDGNHASAFVSISGDTMTGNLTIDQGTAGDAILTLRSDTDNNDEADHPSLEFLQDGDLVGYRIGIGATNADTSGASGNALTISNTTSNGVTSFLWSPDNGTNIYNVFHDGYHPNADKWTTSRTLSLSNHASGSVSWDGSANASLSVTVNKFSVIANDTFTGTYPLVWHTGDQPYTSSFMTINGATDTLNVPNINLSSNDAGASLGPTLELYRDSASPAAGDDMGQILFMGEDYDGTKVFNGRMYSSYSSISSVSRVPEVIIEAGYRVGSVESSAELLKGSAGGVSLDGGAITTASSSVTITRDATAEGNLNVDGYIKTDTIYATDFARALNLTTTGYSRLEDVRPTYLTRADHSTGHLVGSYNSVGANSSYSNPIYTIGSGYNPSNSDLNSMYGIGYSHPNAAFDGINNVLGGWGLYVAAAGVARVGLDASNGAVYATGAAYIPTYYDKDNTGYYLNPASASVLNEIYLDNRIRHNGDTDTYLEFHANDQFRVVIAGAEVMEWGANYALMSDNDVMRFGSGSDFRIWHNGTHNYIRNYNHAGGNIYIQGENTSGTNHNLIVAYTDTSATHVRLYENNGERLRTVSTGVDVYGSVRDGDDTNYYLDAASTSSLYQVDLKNNNKLINYVNTTGNAIYQTIFGSGSSTLYWKHGSTAANLMYLTSSGSLYVDGTYNTFSDQSIKTDIQVIDNAIDKVKQIRGVTYTRSDRDDGYRRAGVIAQEIEQVLPEVVSTNDEGLKSVAYGETVALLIEAIKEQQQQIDELKTIIEGLTSN